MLIVQYGFLLIGCKLTDVGWKHVLARSWRLHLATTFNWLSLSCAEAVRVYGIVATILGIVRTGSWLPSRIFISQWWSVFFSNLYTSFFLYETSVILSRSWLVWLNEGWWFHFATFDRIMGLLSSGSVKLWGVVAGAWRFNFLISTNLRPLSGSERPTIRLSLCLFFHHVLAWSREVLLSFVASKFRSLLISNNWLLSINLRSTYIWIVLTRARNFERFLRTDWSSSSSTSHSTSWWGWSLFHGVLAGSRHHHLLVSSNATSYRSTKSKRIRSSLICVTLLIHSRTWHLEKRLHRWPIRKAKSTSWSLLFFVYSCHCWSVEVTQDFVGAWSEVGFGRLSTRWSDSKHSSLNWLIHTIRNVMSRSWIVLFL